MDQKKQRRDNKDRQKKQMQQQKNQFNKSGQGAMKKGSKERANSREDKGAAASIEADLNIPPELREIVDDSDDDFPLRFKDHNELMDIFSTLEENNLLEIQRMQEAE